VACQAGPPPRRFVKPDTVGWKATRQGIPISDAQGHVAGLARVRRIVRAASSVSKGATSTHHVCLVEVVRVNDK
jgi:hypothetical protein